MAALRSFTLLGSSILRKSRNWYQIPPLKFDICGNPSMRFKHYSSSVLTFDSDASALATDGSSVVSAHPWPEWVNFVDRLKAKGYITRNPSDLENGDRADDEEVSVYTDMKLVKDACLSFARDRFDIFKSLSTQDIQAIVETGCPNLFRKAVNSSKRLRAYLGLDEGDVCSSCNLRGSCDRAYVMLHDTEAVARTVDVVRVLLLHALDPLVYSGEDNLPGRELIESSSRKLLFQLIELGETLPDPDYLKPASAISQRKKQSFDLSDNECSKNAIMKTGDWVCTRRNFIHTAKSGPCSSCGYDDPVAHMYDGEMKRGDWICPECNFMNFARNKQCLKCKAEGPKNLAIDGIERKKGDWDCPQCSFMNFASKRQCFRCQEPRPQRQLRPGDWECPECDFMNFSRNTVCKKCNLDRPPNRL